MSSSITAKVKECLVVWRATDRIQQLFATRGSCRLLLYMFLPLPVSFSFLRRALVARFAIPSDNSVGSYSLCWRLFSPFVRRRLTLNAVVCAYFAVHLAASSYLWRNMYWSRSLLAVARHSHACNARRGVMLPVRSQRDARNNVLCMRFSRCLLLLSPSWREPTRHSRRLALPPLGYRRVLSTFCSYNRRVYGSSCLYAQHSHATR